MPNQMMNSGASAMRGMPLSARMNGSSTLPTKAKARQQHAGRDAEQRATAVTDEGLAQRDDEMLEQVVLHPVHEMPQHAQRA